MSLADTIEFETVFEHAYEIYTHARHDTTVNRYDYFNVHSQGKLFRIYFRLFSFFRLELLFVSLVGLLFENNISCIFAAHILLEVWNKFKFTFEGWDFTACEYLFSGHLSNFLKI